MYVYIYFHVNLHVHMYIFCVYKATSRVKVLTLRPVFAHYFSLTVVLFYLCLWFALLVVLLWLLLLHIISNRLLKLG